MRSILAVAVLVLSSSVSAMSPDKETAARQVGLWSAELHADGYYLYGEFEYREDGSSVGRGYRVVNDQVQRFDFAGTWHIDDQVLVFSKQEPPGCNHDPSLHVYRDRIETLTDNMLVLVSETGERSVRYRLDYSRLFTR